MFVEPVSPTSRRMTTRTLAGRSSCVLCVCFFFQAEDGIRDYKVTGVQTCALPILVLCKAAFAKELDKLTFPGTQGGPLVHTIAAKAVCLKEAMEPSFKEYQKQVVANTKAMAAAVAKRGFRIVTGGTDNHLFLIEVHSRGITGSDAEKALDRAGITVNKNSIPFDPL